MSRHFDKIFELYKKKFKIVILTRRFLLDARARYRRIFSSDSIVQLNWIRIYRRWSCIRDTTYASAVTVNQ